MGGRTLSPRYAVYACIPPRIAGVYVIERSDGLVKVGVTRNFRERIKFLHRDCEAVGAAILRFSVAPGHWREEFQTLANIYKLCPPVAATREMFSGITFEQAVAARASKDCDQHGAAVVSCEGTFVPTTTQG